MGINISCLLSKCIALHHRFDDASNQKDVVVALQPVGDEDPFGVVLFFVVGSVVVGALAVSSVSRLTRTLAIGPGPWSFA